MRRTAYVVTMLAGDGVVVFRCWDGEGPPSHALRHSSSGTEPLPGQAPRYSQAFGSRGKVQPTTQHLAPANTHHASSHGHQLSCGALDASLPR